MPKPLILNAFAMNTPSHLSPGLWRHGRDKGVDYWNVVTSALDSAARNFGLPAQREHDARYDRAEEFLAVCYKLWEGSDWLHVAATRAEDGVSVTGLVARRAPGVSVADDWDGFGQRLTASGTARFTNVALKAADTVEDGTIFPYTLPFYQLVHLATLAGIGRAAARELAQAVPRRTRGYGHGAAPRAGDDPQVLQVVGRGRGAAYAAGAIVGKVAEAVGRAAGSGNGSETIDPQAVVIAELESAQAVTVVSDLILNATMILFDALGASATSVSTAIGATPARSRPTIRASTRNAPWATSR